jgi:endogenous inhibitor of DNA gyrase (YacG/DUF329 family)
MADLEATVNCGSCGAPASWPDNIADQDEVKCAQCGESLGTYREILDAVESAAAKKIDDMLGDIFKQ